MDPTKKRIRHVKRLAEAAVPLKHHWETPGPGRGKKLPPKQRVQSGNRSQYLVNRIARDRPVLATLLRGEKTGDNVARECLATGAALRPEGFAVVHKLFPPHVARQSR